VFSPPYGVLPECCPNILNARLDRQLKSLFAGTFGRRDDGTRTRDLRRDGPILMSPVWVGYVRLHDVSTDAFATLSPDGGSVALSLTKPGQNAILSFSADPNTVARLSLLDSTISGGSVTVRNANGDTIATSSFGLGDTSLDTAALTVGGNYTLLVDPRRANTGSFSATFRARPAGAPGPIVPGGAKVSVGWSGVSDDAGLVFDANAGDAVSVVVSDFTMASGSAQILRPDGSELASWPIVDGSAFIDTKTLPASGTYTVRVGQRPAGYGRALFALYAVPQREPVPIAIDGDAIRIEAGVPGENRRLSFNGQAGQTISLVASDGTLSFAGIKLYDPSGNLVASSWTTDSGFLDATKLESDGTFELVLDPSGPATGAETLELNLVPTPDPLPIEPSGSVDASATDPTDDDTEEAVDPGDPDSFPGEQDLALTVPGENVGFTFAGRADEQVSVLVRNSSIPLAATRIIAPDGSEVAAHAGGPGKAFEDPVTLPEAGQYRLVFDPSEAYTGTASLTLFEVPPPQTGELKMDSPVALDLPVPGETARLNVSGEAGQAVEIHVISRGVPGGFARLQKVDGTNLDSSYFDDDWNERTLATTLDTTGQYTFVLDPTDSSTGSAQVWMTDPTAPPAADPGDGSGDGDPNPTAEPVVDDGTPCAGSDRTTRASRTGRSRSTTARRRRGRGPSRPRTRRGRTARSLPAGRSSASTRAGGAGLGRVATSPQSSTGKPGPWRVRWPYRSIIGSKLSAERRLSRRGLGSRARGVSATPGLRSASSLPAGRR
jgi:hypothetical protein